MVDYLRECMSDFGIVPHDEFKKQFCLRCLRQECTWSIGKSLAFAVRAKNWEEDLFTKVPRVSDEDTQYDTIKNRKFLPVVPNVGSVGSPPVQPPFFSPIVKEEVNNGDTEPEEIKETEPEEIKETKDTEPVPSSESPSPIEEQQGIVQNTPFQQGVMLEPEVKEVVLDVGSTVILDDE